MIEQTCKTTYLKLLENGTNLIMECNVFYLCGKSIHEDNNIHIYMHALYICKCDYN